MNTNRENGEHSAEQIIRTTGISGDLKNAIFRNYENSNYGGTWVSDGDLSEWTRVVGGLQPPSLEWTRKQHGSDVVVSITLTDRKSPWCGDFGLLLADELVRGMVADKLASPRRYHADYPGAAKRETRDRAKAEKVLVDAIRLVWTPLASRAISAALSEPMWRTVYHWAMPPVRESYAVSETLRVGGDIACPSGIDPQMPYIEAIPITPAARRIAREKVTEVIRYVAATKAKLLAVSVPDVLEYAQTHYPADSRIPPQCASCVNRAGYLPRIAGIDNPRPPVGYYAAIEADADIVAHAAQLRAKLSSSQIGV